MSKKKKKLSESQVTSEKEGLVALAIVLISAGMVMIQIATLDEPMKLIGGIVLIVAGIVILIGRGRLKFHRWSSVANDWRGVDHNHVGEEKTKVKIIK